MTRPRYIIQREPSTEFGTQGEWLDDRDNHICYTIERPWMNNQNMISCIAAGEYATKRYRSPSKGMVFMLEDKNNRKYIEVHVANTMLDLKGCIGPGAARMMFNQYPAVINSKKTMNMLLATMPAQFILEIRNG